jgi:AraC-like DNA-binding protein
MLTVHLLRSYGSSERPPIPHRGGLAPRQLRRVLDYIDAHLTDELGLVELAAIAELSPHHFGEAFKISVGKSPFSRKGASGVRWNSCAMKTARLSRLRVGPGSRARAVCRRIFDG